MNANKAKNLLRMEETERCPTYDDLGLFRFMIVLDTLKLDKDIKFPEFFNDNFEDYLDDLCILFYGTIPTSFVSFFQE